jgi:hypothetical protein
MTQAQDFTVGVRVAADPAATFAAVADPRGWWSRDIEGETDRLGGTFEFGVPGVHRSVQRISAFDPDRLVEWEVTDAELTFVADTREWVGTRIRFELAPAPEGATDVTFTHVGLTPDVECYDACSTAWTSYVTTSLRALAETGAGRPDQEDDGGELDDLTRNVRSR